MVRRAATLVDRHPCGKEPEVNARYTVAQHGDLALDLDYEADTIADALRIVNDEIPVGAGYQIFDGNALIVEAVKLVRS